MFCHNCVNHKIPKEYSLSAFRMCTLNVISADVQSASLVSLILEAAQLVREVDVQYH